MRGIVRWRDPNKPRRVYREQAEQIAIAEWLDWALAPPAFYTYFPAGEGRLSKEHARQLKRKGLKPGMPDLWFGFNGFLYTIENKVPKSGRLSANQVAAHERLTAAGIRVAVATSLEQVRAKLLEWGLPIRETKPSGERITRSLRAALASEGAAVAAPEGAASRKARSSL